MIPAISEEVALVTDDWKVYQAEDVDTNSISMPVCHHWAHVFKGKSQQGEFMYFVLQKLLSLAHGNADGEQSRSANKKTVFPDKASLSDLTIKWSAFCQR